MGDFTNYHSRGTAGPKIVLLDGSLNTGTSYTFTSVAASAYPGLAQTTLAPQLVEAFESRDVMRTGADGTLIPEVGGFYYHAQVDLPILDKTWAGYAASIINHCQKGYYVYFYPHSDNTKEYYKAYVTGTIDDFDNQGRKYALGHQGTLNVTAVAPIEQIPFTVQSYAVFLNKSAWGTYDNTDKKHSSLANKSAWATYDAADLVYIAALIEKNPVVNIVDP